MNILFTSLDAGRMPALENMPIAFVKPLQLLEKMDCVKLVASTEQHNALLLEITFTNALSPEYRQALNCFRGLRPTALRVNGSQRYMQLTVSTLNAVA